MKLLFWKKLINEEKSFKVKFTKFEYPFWRKYPNGFLNYIGMYKIADLENDKVLRKFRLYQSKNLKFGKSYKQSIVIIPIKENKNWKICYGVGKINDNFKKRNSNEKLI